MARAVAALFLAVVPSYLSALLHLRSLALTGGIASLRLAASAAAQLVLRRVPMRPAMAAGSVLLIVGLGGFVLAVPTGSTGLLLLSTLLAGCGQGLAYMGSTVLVTEVTPPEQRGNVLSTYYVMIYLVVGVPVLGAGFGAGWIGLYGVVVAFAGLPHRPILIDADRPATATEALTRKPCPAPDARWTPDREWLLPRVRDRRR